MSEVKPSEFYIACRTGDLTAVERLLNHLSFYDLNRLEPNGSTALHAAAFFGHTEIVRRLVEHGAIVRTLKNNYNLTPAQETTHENIRRLLEPDANYQPRKRFINDNYDENSSKRQTIRNPSSLLFSRALLAYVKAKKGLKDMDDKERREWVVTYDNNCYVLEYVSREYMRKWLTKIPLASILKTINTDYVDNPSTELTDKNRAAIREDVIAAMEYDDPLYLIHAYTLETNFYRQLNRDLADKGLDFRNRGYDVEKYCDDEPPTGVSECLFAAILIHHPYFTPLYYGGVTYRGMNITEADLYDYAPGTRIFSRSFLSTSKSIHPVLMRLQIDSPAIVPVICIYRTIQSLPATSLAIANYSAIPSEDEVLIFPYVAFRIVKLDFASFHLPDGGTATVIFLDQITDEPRSWPLCGHEEKPQEQVEERQQEHVKKVPFPLVTPTMTSLKAPREIEHSFSQPIRVLYEAYRHSTDQYVQLCLSLHSNLLCLHDLGVGVVENFRFNDWLMDPFDVFMPNELEWLRDSTHEKSLSIPLEPAVRFLSPFSQKDMAAEDFNSDNSSILIDIEEVICRE